MNSFSPQSIRAGVTESEIAAKSETLAVALYERRVPDLLGNTRRSFWLQHVPAGRVRIRNFSDLEVDGYDWQ